MKNLAIVLCMFVAGLLQAQEENVKYEVEGELVKATYFYENGKVRQQGYFKDKKLTGSWVSFNEKGYKTAVAVYKDGKKDGKWYVSGLDGIKQVTYKSNKVLNVTSSDVAFN